MSFRRIQRVKELLKVEISDIIFNQMKDPRIGFVTVIDVDLSNDLRHATVYISVYGDERAKEETMAVLDGAKGFIKSELGKRIRIRFLPELTFEFDESIERGSRLLDLLKELNSGEEVE